MIILDKNTPPLLHDEPVKEHITPIKASISFFLVVFLIIGLVAIHFFVLYEKNRDFILWQDKLAYLTQTEKKSIDAWFDEKITGLQSIAENPTLKLYLSNINSPLSADGEVLSPREKRSYKRYLKELLIIKASELNFSHTNQLITTTNRNQQFKNGLILTGLSGKTIVSGHSDFPLPSSIAKSIQDGLFIEPVNIEELIEVGNQQLRLAFILPIFPPQVTAFSPDARAIAYIIAVKDIAPDMKQLLNNRIATHQHEEVSLIRKNGEQVLYLFSASHQLPGIKRQLSIDTTNLAAAFALNQPNIFQEKLNYAGEAVLFHSAVLNNIPWTVIHSTNKDFALAESNTHANTLYMGLIVLFLAFIALIGFIWRQGTSQKYQKELHAMEKINIELNKQNQTLNLITDNLSDYVMLVDSNQTLTYANKALSNMFGISNENLIGQNIGGLLKNSTARQIQHVVDSSQSRDQLFTLDDNDKTVLKTYRIPLLNTDEGLSMIVATDISSTLKSEQQKEKTMQQAVLMLTKILEKHDDYSAEHSARVKQVAVALGQTLLLNKTELFNLELSASLINIGKFDIPREILRKKQALTDEERIIVEGHISHTIKMLENINIDRQIIQAISQSCERLDGSGYPNQLLEDEINSLARILAIANAFVAMTNPRPWRTGMAQAEALDILINNQGYDKKFALALYSYVENTGEIKFDNS
ncbi:MAG: PAS domain-containing protein [Methylococcales bacterium]|nr:PAS domain-containing protein [Methylococcales bacterium]